MCVCKYALCVFLSPSSPYSWGRVSPWPWSSPIQLADWRKSPRNPSVSTPISRITGTCHPAQPFEGPLLLVWKLLWRLISAIYVFNFFMFYLLLFFFSLFLFCLCLRMFLFCCFPSSGWEGFLLCFCFLTHSSVLLPVPLEEPGSQGYCVCKVNRTQQPTPSGSLPGVPSSSSAPTQLLWTDHYLNFCRIY